MNIQQSSLPLLKKRFPFRLAVPSYILPDAIIPNVRFLGPHFDEIELVLFESRYQDNLPSRQDIHTLAGLGRDLDLTYNVHLPIDVYLGRNHETRRKKDVETIFRFYEATMDLDPSCWILHLDVPPEKDQRLPGIEQVEQSLDELLEKGMDPTRVAIENLDHPLDMLTPAALPRGFALCQDLGHLMNKEHDLKKHLAVHTDQTIMFHVHGIDAIRDHKSLSNIPDHLWEPIKTGLAGYTGGVTLEVFSLQDLLLSCPRLEEFCHA
jgi:sugar phosphate isomerase/epimerase